MDAIAHLFCKYGQKTCPCPCPSPFTENHSCKNTRKPEVRRIVILKIANLTYTWRPIEAKNYSAAVPEIPPEKRRQSHNKVFQKAPKNGPLPRIKHPDMLTTLRTGAGCLLSHPKNGEYSEAVFLNFFNLPGRARL